MNSYAFYKVCRIESSPFFYGIPGHKKVAQNQDLSSGQKPGTIVL